MTQGQKADLGLAFCSFLWGVTFVVVKGALGHASVFMFIAIRFSLASILMAAFHPKALRGLRPPEILAGFRLGFFLFSGYALQTLGLVHTTPAKSAFVTGSSVVLVPLLMALFWRHPLKTWVYFGALAALAGLYLLTVPAEGPAGLNRGDVLTFTAAGLFAIHIILVSSYTREHPVGALNLLQVATTAACGLVILAGASWTGWERPRLEASRELIWALLLTAVFATAIAFTIQLWAQQYTSPGHAAILFTLEPVFATLTSIVMLRERLGGRALTGGVLVVAGILLAELKGPTQAAADSPGPVTESH